MMMNNCVRSEVLRENFRPGTGHSGGHHVVRSSGAASCAG